jgi:hypothetical protein
MDDFADTAPLNEEEVAFQELKNQLMDHPIEFFETQISKASRGVISYVHNSYCVNVRLDDGRQHSSVRLVNKGGEHCGNACWLVDTE